MKILFSVYTEDLETRNVELKESIWVQTDWTIREIDNHIALFEGFRSDIMIGENLSFFDYYCFFDNHNELIRKIKTIPICVGEKSRQHTPLFFRVVDFNPGRVGLPNYPEGKRCYLYNVRRYECGANSYDALVYWASAHPFEMIFISGVIFDFSKWFVLKMLKLLGIKKGKRARRPFLLNTKKLYRNFSKMTKIDVNETQITKFNRIKPGTFHVMLRTSENRRFKIKCSANGLIESLEEVSKKSRE